MSDVCARCATDISQDGVGRGFLYNGATAVWDRVCHPCELAEWSCAIKFHFAWGIPQPIREHLQSHRVLTNLKNWFYHGPPCQVHFVNRRETETLDWQWKWNDHDRPNPPRPPYSYRGWCGGSKIVVIVDADGIETPESIEWITYHELGHHECQQTARMADAAWYRENANEGRKGYEWLDDAGHEADSEERHVNRLATAFMDGRQYDRLWWRKRVNAFLAGEPLPDEYAVTATS